VTTAAHLKVLPRRDAAMSEAMVRPAGRYVPAADGAASNPSSRTVAGIGRAPVRPVNEIGRPAGGGVVRLNPVLLHPYLVTSPERVQQLLRDTRTRCRREAGDNADNAGTHDGFEA
jgi:hypothetical protein